MARTGFDQMPGSMDFVHCIAPKFAGRTALVTSSAELFVPPFLSRHDIAQYFPENLIITEDTIVAKGLEGKPAPDPYRLAIERLGAKNLLVFEDTVSGTASAKAAGATVIALGFDVHSAQRLRSQDIPHPPDALVESFAKAKQLLGL
jgi:beta-phosphoglucomutase-like phosphatase (HAD superfamily)